MQFSRYESISEQFFVLKIQLRSFLEPHRGFLKMKRKSKNQLKYSISLYIKIISNCRLIVIFLRPLLWVAKTKPKSKNQLKYSLSLKISKGCCRLQLNIYLRPQICGLTKCNSINPKIRFSHCRGVNATSMLQEGFIFKMQLNIFLRPPICGLTKCNSIIEYRIA